MAQPERAANGRQPLCPDCIHEPVAAASRGSRLAFGASNQISQPKTMKTLRYRSAVAVLGLLLLTGCCTSRPAHRCWEYRVDTVELQSPPRSGLEEHLNQHAKEGWVLDQFVERGNGWLVVMKRLK
jgi:hypothetical protein